MDSTSSFGRMLLLWSRSLFFLLLAVGLAWLAVPHFEDGRAQDAAIPIPNYMIAQTAVPKAAYRAAEIALARANAADGEAMIARAEAALRAGAKPADVIPDLEQALTHQPASARGWTLLADAWAPTDKKKAANALALALELAPKNYWLSGMRAQAAAQLWEDLDADAKKVRAAKHDCFGRSLS